MIYVIWWFTLRRKSKDKDNAARLHEIEEKISAATAALQQAIGGVASSVNKLSLSVSASSLHFMLSRSCTHCGTLAFLEHKECARSIDGAARRNAKIHGRHGCENRGAAAAPCFSGWPSRGQGCRGKSHLVENTTVTQHSQYSRILPKRSRFVDLLSIT